MASTVNRGVPTQEDFDQLLAWLDPDREKAGHKYEAIRASLLRLFLWRGVPDAEAEDLADETIDRVTRKVAEIVSSYEGNPAHYFHSVARNVQREYASKQKPTVPLSGLRNKLPDNSASEEQARLERVSQALDSCLQNFPKDNRRLLLEYYTKEKRAKIDVRKALSQELGVHANALRVKVHRLRVVLWECVRKKLKESGDWPV